jgi:hypothetical protein
VTYFKTAQDMRRVGSDLAFLAVTAIVRLTRGRPERGDPEMQNPLAAVVTERGPETSRYWRG